MKRSLLRSSKNESRRIHKNDGFGFNRCYSGFGYINHFSAVL